VIALNRNGKKSSANGTGGQIGKLPDGTKVTSATLRTKLEKQGYRCAITGRELTPDTASVDHSYPLSRGGANSIENIEILHSDINQAKGAMTKEEFVAMCREVVEWASNQ
jgi:5-methylcytosine-specific restriction endonuclease McrA